MFFSASNTQHHFLCYKMVILKPHVTLQSKQKISIPQKNFPVKI